MHIKHIHEMIEKLAEYCKCDIEKGYDKLDVNVVGGAVDMLKDLCDAEYYARLAKCLEKEEDENKEEEKYFLKMLKEEKQDEYKRMKEEYGEDEGERRFYDNYRYANGRFAPKGRGSYEPRRSGRRGRRGYEEMPYMMMPEMYDPEYYRDLDRENMGRMYYSGGGSSGGSSGGNSGGSSGDNFGGNSGGGSSSVGMSGGSMGGSSRGYSEGYDDGSRRGYDDGYSDGQREGRRSGGSQSRYDRAKRGYEEAKEQHKGGTSEDKQITMREAEKMVNVFMDGLEEALEDSPVEVKNMVKTKGMGRLQKLQ